MSALKLLLALAIAAPPEAPAPAPPDAQAAAPAVASGRTIVVPHALVSPLQEARIPALRAGRLIAFDVREGDEVDEGASLARFDSAEAEAKALAARESHLSALVEASHDLKVQASAHAVRLHELHRRLTEDVVAEMPRAVTAIEREQTVVRHEQSLIETELERKNVVLAGHQAAVREAERTLAEIDLAERTLSAPFAAVVVERFAKEHEWVQQGEPVLHLMNMERLQAEAFLEMADAAPAHVVGAKTSVAVAVGGGRIESFEGTVAFVSPVLEADGAYRIRIEIENRRDRDAWLLRPGMTGELAIVISGDAETAPLASTEDQEREIPVATDTRATQPTTDEEPVAPETNPVETYDAARLELNLDEEIVAALRLESGESGDAEGGEVESAAIESLSLAEAGE